jgi:hypothetical protein
VRLYNTAVGIISTPDYGYHETLTVVYMHLVVVHTKRLRAPAACAADTNAVFDTFGRTALLHDFYTRAVPYSAEARARWTPLDRTPLPIT